MSNPYLDYKELIKMINTEIDKRNISYDINAKVISVSGNDITVLFNGASTNITLKNYSGQVLATNDLVIVHVMNGNLNNAFVSHKKVT